MKMRRFEFASMVRTRDYNKINSLVESGIKVSIKNVFELIYANARTDKEIIDSVSRLIRIDKEMYEYLTDEYFSEYDSENIEWNQTVLYLFESLLRRSENESKYLEYPVITSTEQGKLDNFQLTFVLVKGGVDLYAYSQKGINNIFYSGDLDVIKRLDDLQPIRFEIEYSLGSWISGCIRSNKDPHEGIIYFISRGSPITGSMERIWFWIAFRRGEESLQLSLKTAQLLQALGESIYEKKRYKNLRRAALESLTRHERVGAKKVIYEYLLYRTLIDNYSTASLKSISLATIELNDGDLSLLPQSYYYQTPPFPLITMKNIEDKVYQEINKIHSQN